MITGIMLILIELAREEGFDRASGFIAQIISARHQMIANRWKETFGKISYYC